MTGLKRTRAISAKGRGRSLIPDLKSTLQRVLARPTVLSAFGQCPPHDGAWCLWRTNVRNALCPYGFASLGGLAIATSRQGRLLPPCGRKLLRRSGWLHGRSSHRPGQFGAVDHIRCKITASLRATATRALLRLLRFAMRMPQALSVDHLETRVSSTLAAS